MKKSDNALNERAESLLKALIQEYIKQGQPIGSKTLAESRVLALSPASIRNVLKDLEDLGLIHSPHTSAGRVPTIQGYRYFVDSLLTVKPVEDRFLENVMENLAGVADTQHLAVNASEFLSEMTAFAGLVTLPNRKRTSLLQIEFVPLSENKILSIVVTQDHEVQNHIIEVNRPFSKAELEAAANYLNNRYSGRLIDEIRREIVEELRQAHESMDKMMQAAVSMADKALNQEEAENDELVLAGQVNLMGYNDLGSVETLKSLFEAFNEKRDILHLLDQCISNDGVQIFIGEESGYQVLGDCSVVTANYSVDGQVIGSVGVIGPTRMRYDKVIPIVDITAKVLGNVLKSR